MNKQLQLTYWAVFFLFLGIFVSVSLLPLYQILIFVPCCYFFSKKNFIQESPKSRWFLVALILVTILSNIINYSSLSIPLKSFMKVKFFIFAILAYYPLQKLLESELFIKKYKFLLSTFFFTMIAASFYGVLKAKFGFDLLTMRAGDYNPRSGGFTKIMRYGYGTAMVLSLLFPLALHWEKIKNKLPKKMFIAAAIFGLIGLYASSCRGALLGLLISIPFSLYFYKKKIVYYSIFVITLIVAFLVAIPMMGGSQNSRFLMKVNSYSNQVRFSLYQSALYAFKEKPIFGHGNLQLSYEVKRIKKKYDLAFKDFESHAHNIFLEAAANTGILGLLCLLGFFFFWLKEMWEGSFWQRQLMIPFLVTLLVSSQFEVIFDANTSSLIFFLYPLSFVKFPNWKDTV